MANSEAEARENGADQDAGTEAESDPLEDLLADAEQSREAFVRSRDRLEQIRDRMMAYVNQLEDEGVIETDRADEIRETIEAGEYSEARAAIQSARESTPQFDAPEKQAFAEAFEDTYIEVSASLETIAESLFELDDGIDREEMVALLYGKHSTLNKGEIRAVFDTFDEVPKTPSNREMARVLSAFNRDLNIEPTTKVLKAIREQAER